MSLTEWPARIFIKQPIHRWIVLLSLSLMLGCHSTSVSKKSSPKAPGEDGALDNTDLLASEQEESRIEAMARFATGIIYEMEDEHTAAFDQFYQAALADPYHEELVVDVSRRLLQRKQPDKALELLTKASASPAASGLLYAWLGLTYAQLGKNDQAINANNTAIKKMPRSLAAYQNLAQIYLQNGQGKEALQVLDEAARQPDLDAVTLIGLAEVLFGNSQLYKTESEEVTRRMKDALNRAAKLKPASPRVLEKLADGYKLVGENQKAADIYLQVLEKEPDRTNLREKLTDIYLKANDKKRAREQLQALVRGNPTSPIPYIYLSAISQEEKNWAQAEEYLQTALMLSPDNEQLHYELAGLQVTGRKPKNALATLSKARTKFPPSFTMEFYTALAYNGLKKYQEAIKHFTTAEIFAQAMEPKPRLHVLYFQLAATHERKHDYAEAEKYFVKCLELSPKFVEALNYCGYMWADHGVNLEKAKTMIEQAVQIEPKNAAYLDSLGWVFYKLKQPAEALSWLLKAVEHNDVPDATLMDHLGDIYSDLKQPDKARENWEKALSLVRQEIAQHDKHADEPEAALFDQLGDLHAKLKQFDQASEAWRKSLSIEPSEKVQKKLENQSSSAAPSP